MREQLTGAAAELCLHCERRPRSADPKHRRYRLCAECAAVPNIRVNYRRRHGWTRERERRIQQMVARAKAQLPLFED